MTPHEARIAARLAKYDNSEAERENIARVDAEVFDRVRVMETHIAEATQGFMSAHAAHVETADEVETKLRQLIRYRVQEGGQVDRDLVRQFDQLRLKAEDTLRALGRATEEADWHIQRCDNPYAAYMTLIEKYPQLARRVAI